MRDRIKELRRVSAASLRRNPRNWRTHPPAQQAALRAVLDEVGFAGALLARELADGALELIDGHLRAETAPDAILPVLVLDVDQQEADLILATHDPLAAMAGTDSAALAELLAESPLDRQVLDSMFAAAPDAITPTPQLSTDVPPRVPALFQLVVECRDEEQQAELYERLAADGVRCRVITL